jgi:hypothetical protein
MEQEHDKGFRDLLSNASVFVSLLTTFVKESWTTLVKPEQLEQVHTSFITSGFEKREADIIYKLKRQTPLPKGGRLTVDVYFYCLLELQSSVDFSMPVRLLIYMVSLWIELLKNTPDEERTRKDFRLPVIIPLVLYNGLKPWTAELNFAKVCADSGLFGDYALNFKYYLIDVNRLESDDLLKLDNVLATVFFIDQNRGETVLAQFGRISQVLPRVVGWPEVDERIFLKWLQDVALPRLTNSDLLERIRADLASLNEETEVSMFVSNFATNFEKAMKNLERQEADLAQIKNDLAGTRNELVGTKNELAGTRNELARANARATRAEQEKAQANARLEQELAEARQEIERLKRRP